MSLVNGFFWIILILAAYAGYNLVAETSETREQTASKRHDDATNRPYRGKASQSPVTIKKINDRSTGPIRPCAAEFKFFEIGRPDEHKKAS